MDKVEVVPYQVEANIDDVAYWFLLKENMSNKKIQKLCYYAQAWSLVKLNMPIAKNAVFQAWVHGPVNIDLYKIFKKFGWRELKIKKDKIEEIKERIDTVFNSSQKELLESVWETYGEFAADELESLTHSEDPWLEQREGLNKFECSQNIISDESMKKYYSSIQIR